MSLTLSSSPTKPPASHSTQVAGWSHTPVACVNLLETHVDPPTPVWGLHRCFTPVVHDTSQHLTPLSYLVLQARLLAKLVMTTSACEVVLHIEKV